jgi:hypothetical protein
MAFTLLRHQNVGVLQLMNNIASGIKYDMYSIPCISVLVFLCDAYFHCVMYMLFVLLLSVFVLILCNESCLFGGVGKKIPAVSIGIIIKIHTNNVNIGQCSCCTILYVDNLMMDWPKCAVRRYIEFV